MCKFFTDKLFLIMLLLSIPGFRAAQASSRVNSNSNPLGSKTSDLCRTLFKDVSKLKLTEKDRVNRIEQVLDEIELGNCYYCLNVVVRLLEKNDLKEGSRFKGVIDSLTRQRVGCTILLLPQLISKFDYEVPLEKFNDFSKFKRYDLLEKNIFWISEMSWQKELIISTLFSNNNSDMASKYIVEILSQFAKPETLSEHIRLLGAVVECNPIDERVITAVLRQSIFMRKISLELTRKGIDEIYPSYKAELVRLNTIVEWNKYKNDNFTRVDNYGRNSWSYVPPNGWDWEKEGTIDFLNELLVNGYTVVDE